MIYRCIAPGSDMIFWFVISAFFRLVTAAFNYDRSDPGFPENFDPQFADPLGRITCGGPLPYANWPSSLEQDGHVYNPATFTLQELCAKPQYGGARYGHLGGFCPYQYFGNRDNSARSATIITFDLSNQAEASRQLSIPRLQLYCMLRCHCTATPDVTPRIKPYAAVSRSLSRRYGAGLHISPVNPDVDVFSQYRFIRLHQHTASSIQINYWQEAIDPYKRPNFGRHYVYLAPENRIICDNRRALPSFVLPDGWQYEDFGSYQELCATAFDGGNKNANAGGFCDTRSQPEPVVAFSEEMTPSLAFTLRGSSRADLWRVNAIQMHCFSACWCRYLNIDEALQLGKLSISDGKSTGSRPSTKFSSGRECGSSSDQFTCPVVLPEDGSGSNPPVCGQRCDKYDDCTGFGKPESCRCVVDPSSFQAKTVGGESGVDAVCLTMGLTLAGAFKHYRPQSLGGRAIAPEEKWWERSDLGCPCNYTYVSQSCCHEPSGLVWEPADMKMGSLVRQE